MKKIAATILTVLAVSQAHASGASDQIQTVDLGNDLKNTRVEVSASSTGAVEVLIPGGDDVHVRLLKSNVDGGCSSQGVSNGGMVWTVSLQVGIGAQGESCTFKITEDGKSANVTLFYSASDD